MMIPPPTKIIIKGTYHASKLIYMRNAVAFADVFSPKFLTPKLRRVAHTRVQPLVKSIRHSMTRSTANRRGKNLIVQQTCNMQYVRMVC